MRLARVAVPLLLSRAVLAVPSAANGQDDLCLADVGKDRLEGSSADDVLIGGPGADRADGSLGNDRCEAEKQTRCDR